MRIKKGVLKDLKVICCLCLITSFCFAQKQLLSFPHQIFEAKVGTEEWGNFSKSGQVPKPDFKYKIVFSIPYSQENQYLYTHDNQKATLRSSNGVYFGGKYNKTSDRFFGEEFYFLPLKMDHQGFQEFSLIIENSEGLLKDFSFLSSSVRTPNLDNLEVCSEKEFLKKVLSIRAKDKETINLINLFVGALGFTSIFVFLLFFFNGLHEFLYYGLYLFSYFLFGIFHTRFYSEVGLWLGNTPLLHQNLPESFIWVGMFFYGFFAIYLLQINKKELPKLLLYLKFISWYSLLCAFIVGVTSVFFNNQTWNDYIFNFIRFTYSPLGAVGILWILIKVKSKLSWILAIGISLWAILGNYSSFFAVQEGYELTSVSNGNNSALFWVIIGLLSESTMFSAALGIRIKMSEDERSKSKETLIEKLSEIKVLKEQENEVLEKKVLEKTTELLRAKAVLEEQKQFQIKQSYEKQIAISEMSALRSQMNPHFIFNSLNSIRHLVLTDQKKKSAKYLSKFAKLLRQILEFSRTNKVTLKAEIENIRIYLELESERFDDSFRYDIDTSDFDAIELEEIEIPPLLLQPFVENAILHGLRNSPKIKKELKLSLSKIKEGMCIEIADNGIGRVAAAKIRKHKEQSLGTKITQERIQIFNETYDTNIDVQFLDSDNGTIVKLLVLN